MKRTQRYWPGQAPQDEQDSSSDEDHAPTVPEQHIEAPESSSDEEQDSEEERQRDALLQRALQLRQAESSEESPQDSSSEESSSEESSEEEPKVLLKPVFIPKTHRESAAEKLKLEQEQAILEEKKKQQLEERRKESHLLAQDQIRKDMQGDAQEQLIDVDDTDGLNEQEEHAAWKLRELGRIKREKMEQQQRDQEILDIERRRQLTDAQILKEDEDKAVRERSRIKFMQKYYHKGAFYADQDILNRDYNAPTLEDKFDIESLPAVMQVKNFGKAGRSKWTHLSNEDTSKPDAGWNIKSEATKRTLASMGGMKSSVKKHKS